MNAVARAVALYPSRAAFARQLGVSGEAVRKWESGRISVERAIQIHTVTKGAVTVRELRPDLPADVFVGSPPALSESGGEQGA